MIGKDKCKMLKEIRREIAKENDIQIVIEDCTYQGRCKGTCPKCEAEVAYLEEQLEKRKNLGKAVCLAGISAAMFTSTLQANNVQASQKNETIYSQGFTSDTDSPDGEQYAGIMPFTPSPEVTESIPPKFEGVAYETDEPTQSPTELPLPEGTMLPTTTEPVITEAPATVTPTAVVTETVTPTATPTITPTNTPSPTPFLTPTPIVIPKDSFLPERTPTTVPTKTPNVTTVPTKKPTVTTAPTKTPTITAVPTPTDEYLVFTPSPTPAEIGNTVTTESPSNAPIDTEQKKKCIITYFDEDGKTIFEIQKTAPETNLQNIPNPVREGYLFDGWYLMGQEQIKISTDTKVSGDMNIIAHWKKVTVKATTLRKVKSLSDGTLYITWGKVKDAAGYRILLASNAGMTKNKRYLTTGTKKTSVKLKGLSEGKKYYVSVCAYKKDSEKKKVYGTCKKSKSVTITRKK